ncbi:MAG: hypothetical protein OFPII_05610 [Osedax symbiont Rs1]|nr:MAG: hypothetical protein OFPII_05610 [Osedax symbiont Rs1]
MQAIRQLNNWLIAILSTKNIIKSTDSGVFYFIIKTIANITLLIEDVRPTISVVVNSVTVCPTTKKLREANNEHSIP